MSLSWRAELRVGLAPDHAALARTPRGLRARTTYEVRPGTGLEEILADEPRRPARLHVVLSNHYVRYALLPASDALDTDAEWLALATHAFESTHGRQARHWSIACTRAGQGEPRVAAAIDRDRIEAVRATASRHPHLMLVGVRPYLSTAFERLRAGLGVDPAWLAVLEPGRLVLGLVARGRWLALRTRAVHGDPVGAIERAIGLEAQLDPTLPVAPVVRVVGSLAQALRAPSPEGLRFEDRTLATGAPSTARTASLASA